MYTHLGRITVLVSSVCHCARLALIYLHLLYNTAGQHICADFPTSYNEFKGFSNTT